MTTSEVTRVLATIETGRAAIVAWLGSAEGMAPHSREKALARGALDLAVTRAQATLRGLSGLTDDLGLSESELSALADRIDAESERPLPQRDTRTGAVR
jgi:hypothetical protein